MYSRSLNLLAERLTRPTAPNLGDVRADVVAVRHQTADTVTLTLRADRSWKGFRAGQHVLVTAEVDGVRHTRAFSLAGSAHAPGRMLELTVKAHPTSTVAAHLRATARPGTVLGLTQAQGDFVLPATPTGRPIVLLSGGSGVTPVLSMLRTLVDEGVKSPVTWVHFARSAEDALYVDEVRAIAGAHANVDVRVETDLFAGLEAGWADADTYLCGPAGFMDAVTDAYEAAGALDRLHLERFTLATTSAAATNTGGALRFSSTGTTVESDGRSILAQAEAAGLRPESGCRMGICATCTRTLESGCVTDLRTGAVTDRPGAPVRICVSAPAGDATVDL